MLDNKYASALLYLTRVLLASHLREARKSAARSALSEMMRKHLSYVRYEEPSYRVGVRFRVRVRVRFRFRVRVRVRVRVSYEELSYTDKPYLAQSNP